MPTHLEISDEKSSKIGRAIVHSYKRVIIICGNTEVTNGLKNLLAP